MCIPFGFGNWQDDAEKWKMIARLMEHPVKKVFHNAMFDLSVFAVHAHIFPKNVWMDTMLAWHACYPEFEKSLAFVCSIFTNQPYYKEMHKTADEGEKEWNPNSNGPKLWEYNCVDACVTHEIVPHLLHELEDNNAVDGFLTDMASLPVALYMTLIGTKIDGEVAKKEFIKNEADAEAVQKAIELAFGKRINTKSPKAMKELLYDELKLPVQYEGVGAMKRVTTNADALIKLALQGFSVVKLLLKNRQIRTKSAFYFMEEDGLSGLMLDPEKVWKDGRIHCGFNVAGTKTGRWSSSGSILGGRNMMNFPDECRGHFVAD
jgi:DNA polymerase-1